MNLFTILVIFAVLFCIIYLISKKIHQMQIKREFEEEKRRKEELKRREQERDKQERRNMYYKSLPNIYNNLSVQTLSKASKLLENLVYYDKNKGDIFHWVNVDMEMLDREREEERNFLKLINPNGKKLWMINDEYWENPLWYDLDLQYIKNLLNRR